MTARPYSASTLRDPASLVGGAVAAQLIGGLASQMSPFMIGGFMEGLLLSERDAGVVAFVEFLALAIAASAIAPLVHRYSCRRIAVMAVALALPAQCASIFTTSLPWLAVLRGLAGIGEGAIYGVSLSVVASRCGNPDKVYGYFQLAWALGSVALFAIGGQVTAGFAHRGILALLAVVTLALAPLLFLIPDDRAEQVGGMATDAAQASPWLGAMTFGAIVLYLTVSSAVYTFSAPMGERAGLDAGAVGHVLTAASLIGLAGAAAATALNVRWGRAVPISGSCIGFVLVALVLCLWRDAIAYVAALVGSVVIFYFSMPYLFGLAAALDRSGRWAAAAGSAYLLGFAAGPLVAGAVISAADYTGLAALSVAFAAAAWGLAMLVNRRLGGTVRAAPPADAPA